MKFCEVSYYTCSSVEGVPEDHEPDHEAEQNEAERDVRSSAFATHARSASALTALDTRALAIAIFPVHAASAAVVSLESGRWPKRRLCCPGLNSQTAGLT